MSAEVAEPGLRRHVAIDLGASSGRVALGTVRDGQLTAEVLHRFPNGGVPVQGGLYWDVLGLWREILHGLRLAAQHGPITSIGVDSWAVDYALLDEYGLLMDGVHHYRDARTDGVMQQALDLVPRAEVYEATGIQFLPFNTAYQLMAHARQAPAHLHRATTLLLVPDLLHFWLSGRAVTEVTNASTTQLYDPRQGAWSLPLLQQFSLPPGLLPEIVPPGTDLGALLPGVAQDTGLHGTRVVASATHDTASAVAAVPAQGGGGWAYLSSGTWSLVGVETARPLITPQALAFNLTNEAGVNGTTRLLKNVMGLWIVQECSRAWGGTDYAALYAGAEAMSGLGSVPGPLIDPDDPRFLPPGLDMPGRVQSYCAQSSQPVPRTPAEITRCVLESLALRCAEVIGQLETVTGEAIRTLHVVGGGSQIRVLNQLLADHSGQTVIAGPVEATLLGNLLIQAEACGSVPVGSVRDLSRSCEILTTYHPATAGGARRRAQFAALTARPPASS